MTQNTCLCIVLELFATYRKRKWLFIYSAILITCQYAVANFWETKAARWIGVR